ncbi:MAG: ribosome maturation factor RimM [Leptolyngbya sp.]|nr:ribosome maturation factor RimM [Leptolyngbya sp.]
MTKTNWIEIGRIVAPQGVRGEVRIYPSSDFPERFLEPGTRWIQRPQQADPQPMTLVRGRTLEGKGLYVIKLDGVEDRTQAEALRGCALLVPAEDRPELDPDEFYAADLIGLRVILQATGAEIGLVTDLYEAGNDLLEVTLHVPTRSSPGQPQEERQGASPPNAAPGSKGNAGSKPRQPRRVLVPFVIAIVPEVNLAEGYLSLTPPDGLLDP